MTMTRPPYDWNDCLRRGEEGALVLDAIFRARGYTVEKAQPRNSHHDRYLIKQGSTILLIVDYKRDEYAATSRNLAIEDVSVIRNGRVEAKGWLHTTIASDFISYVPGFDIAYQLSIAKIRAAWPEIVATFPLRHSWSVDRTGHKEPWMTVCYCPAITWLQAHGLIAASYEAIARQIRLPF
jgi:hypothetical protein